MKFGMFRADSYALMLGQEEAPLPEPTNRARKVLGIKSTRHWSCLGANLLPKIPNEELVCLVVFF